MIQKSEQIAALAAALSKAQSAMEAAAKGKINPHFKSKYADLGSVWDAIREPLTANGLSIIQLPITNEAGGVQLSTILMHSSGEWIEATYGLPPTKADPQGFGSAITYMKRYALSGMGVAPEDDDGNAASRRNGNTDAASSDAASVAMTPTQLGELRNAIAETKTDIEKFCQYLDIGALVDLDAKGFERAMAALAKKRAPRAVAAE